MPLTNSYPAATVLLDISTPILVAIVCEGNLVFDDPVATGGDGGDGGSNTEIQLQAYYILIKGGNMTVGTDANPYQSKARITLYGPPNTIELPLYGAKNIAVRYGALRCLFSPCALALSS